MPIGRYAIFPSYTGLLSSSSIQAWLPPQGAVQGRVIFPGAGYLEMARAVMGRQGSVNVGFAESVNVGLAESVNVGLADSVNPEASGSGRGYAESVDRGFAESVDRGLATSVDRGLENFKTDFSLVSQVDGAMGGSATHCTRAQARRDASHRPHVRLPYDSQVSASARASRAHTRAHAQGGAAHGFSNWTEYAVKDCNMEQTTLPRGGAMRRPSPSPACVTNQTFAARYTHFATNHVVGSLIAVRGVS